MNLEVVTSLARLAQLTPVQFKLQYAKNARSMRWLALKASESINGRYRGKTEDFWIAKAIEYEKIAKGEAA